MFFKQVLFLFLSQFFAGGNFQHVYYNKNNLQDYVSYEFIKTTNIPIQSTTQEPKSEVTQPEEYFIKDNQCPPNKSLHSKADIQAMIDYVYRTLSVDYILKETYEKQITHMRDIYLRDLMHFIEWFNHQPEHLKHILEALDRVRTQYIEPKIKSVSNILKAYPDLEIQFNDKSEKFRQLERSLNRYKAMCSFSCEDNDDHRISKRNVQENTLYCSSLQELYEKVDKKLNESIIEMEKNITHQLSIQSDNYKENIVTLKNNIKEKGLVAFGRTMYEVLILQDEYHHFVDDFNFASIESNIENVQNINIQLDQKMLHLHRAVEKYGQHCRNCAGALINSVKISNEHSEDVIESDLSTIVNSLIEIKLNKTKVQLINEWTQILKVLDDVILESGKDDILDHLKPIQEDVVKLVLTEREKMNKLKMMAPQETVDKIGGLVEKSKELLNNIDAAILYVESLLKK